MEKFTKEQLLEAFKLWNSDLIKGEIDFDDCENIEFTEEYASRQLDVLVNYIKHKNPFGNEA